VTKVCAKVTKGLLSYDFNLRPIPQLATAWSISEDRLRYTFHPRPGVKWHDGQDFTSSDVAFSIELLREAHPRGRSTFAPVTEIETPDPHTAVLVLSKPAPCSAPCTPMNRRSFCGTPIGTPCHKTAKTHRRQSARARSGSSDGNVVASSSSNAIPITGISRSPTSIASSPVVTDAAARTVLFETGEADLGGEGAVQLSELTRIRQLPHIGSETKDLHSTAACAGSSSIWTIRISPI
jgi:peptide/nickel transport system substrate-binding protein